MKTYKLHYLIMLICTASLLSCGWIEGAGRTVEAVGDGTAHALEETGDAVGDAAAETEESVEDAVE